MSDRVRIGVVGTSWWADSMYLPALTRHPLADVRAVVGGRARAHAGVRRALGRSRRPTTRSTRCSTASRSTPLVVLAPNVHHHPYTMAALERGLHVLCEKPLGMTSAPGAGDDRDGRAARRVNMCPFTYSFMPYARYTKELVDDGYIGRPYHLNLRYYADYGRDGAYIWRFDLGEAGAGSRPGTSARTGRTSRAGCSARSRP